MGSCAVALLAVLAMAALSVRAELQLRGVPRLPMQWGLDGKPTWSLPRRMALAFTPALGAVVLTALCLRYGDTHRGLLMSMLIAASFTLGHLLHLLLVARRLRR